MDLANWALRTSPKFTTGVQYQGIRTDQRSGNPNHPSPPHFTSGIKFFNISFTETAFFYVLPLVRLILNWHYGTPCVDNYSCVSNNIASTCLLLLDGFILVERNGENSKYKKERLIAGYFGTLLNSLQKDKLMYIRSFWRLNKNSHPRLRSNAQEM